MEAVLKQRIFTWPSYCYCWYIHCQTDQPCHALKHVSFHMGAFEANLYSTESHFSTWTAITEWLIPIIYCTHLPVSVTEDNGTEDLRWSVNRLFRNKSFEFRTKFKKNKIILNVFTGQLKNLKILRIVLAEEIIKFSK